MRSSLALALVLLASCGEDETRLFNVFEGGTVEEVVCDNAKVSSPWRERAIPTENGLGAIWGTSEANLWIAGGLSTVLHFDGTVWHNRTPSVAVDLRAIHGTDRDNVWVAGKAGIAAHWNGAVWTLIDTGTTGDFSTIWSLAADDVWFGGETGAFHWDGARLVQEDSWPKDQVNSIWAQSPGHVRMVGDTAIHLWNGSTFTTQKIEKSGKLAAIWGTDTSHVYTIGHNTSDLPGFGELNDGEWLFSGAPPRAFYFSLWTRDSRELWAGANDTTIFYYSGQKWCREHLGGLGAINSFYGVSNDHVYAVGAIRGADGQSRPIFLERGER